MRLVFMCQAGRGFMLKSSKLLLTLVILGALLVAPASGHDASTYTINIRDDGPQPSSADGPVIGDAVMWINFDSSNNTTHRIVHDANGDGLYNSSAEWDSGQLQAWSAEGTCMDETGNKTEGCEVSFTLNLTSGEQVGNHTYLDMTYVDGNLSSSVNGTLVVALDSHVGDTYCFGVDCEENDQSGTGASGGSDTVQWLLVLAMFAGAGAMLLGLKMMIFQPRPPQDKWFEQEE